MSVRWRSPHVPYRRPSLGIFFVDRYDSPFGARPEAEVRRVGWSLCAAVASDVRCGRLWQAWERRIWQTTLRALGTVAYLHL